MGICRGHHSAVAPRQARQRPSAACRPSFLRQNVQQTAFAAPARRKVVSPIIASLASGRSAVNLDAIPSRPMVPGLQPHVASMSRDPLHGIAIALAHQDRPAPVVEAAKAHPLVHTRALEQGVEVAAVLDEAMPGPGLCEAA